MARDPVINVTTTADTRPLDRAADALDNVTDRADRLSKAQRETARTASTLDARIDDVTDEVRRYAREIAQAEGNTAALARQMRVAQVELGRLQRARRAMDAMAPAVTIGGGGSGTTSGRGGDLGFGQVLRSPITQGTVGLLTSPAIGAAITAALGTAPLAGVGFAGITAGIVAAVQAPRVREALDGLGEDLAGLGRDFGLPFQQPLMAAAQFIRDELRGLSADALILGGKLSKTIEPLARGLMGFIKAALPGITRAVEASIPVIERFAAELPRLGQHVSNFFGYLAEVGPQAERGMVTLMRVTGNVLEITGALIANLVRINDLVGRLLGADEGPRQIAASFSRVDTSAADAAEAIKAFSEVVQSATSDALGYDGALDAFRRGLLEMSAAVRDNGRSLDETTVKGLSNRAMLRDMVSAALAVRQANIDMGGGTVAAIKQADAAYLRHLGQIRAAAVAAGLNAAAVDALIGRYRALANMPSITKTITLHVAGNYMQAVQAARALGQRIAMAKGGVVAAAQGLVSGAVVTKPTVLFGERGTGAEVFVPQQGISHERGLALADAAAGMHGGRVVPATARPAATGGALTLSLTSGGAGGSLDRLLAAWLHNAVANGVVQLRLGADGRRVGVA